MTVPIAAELSVLRVAAATDPRKLAVAIGAIVRREGAVHVHAVGAGAVNQAVKAIAIARGPASIAGLDLVCRPFFLTEVVDGVERTALGLSVRR